MRFRTRLAAALQEFHTRGKRQRAARSLRIRGLTRGHNVFEVLETRHVLNGSSTSAVGNLLSNQPLLFEENVGQYPTDVEFRGQGRGYDVWLTDDEAFFDIHTTTAESGTAAASPTLVTMSFVGGRTDAPIRTENRNVRVNNYYGGVDPTRWFEGVPNYGRVVYDDVYAGIDVAFYGQGSELEFDFLVDAGIDPEQARMKFDGATSLHVDDEGRLVVGTAAGDLHFKRPVAYQEIAGNRLAVEAGYVVALDGSVSLDVGTRQPDMPLVIDPVVTFSTYLGGSGVDSIRAVLPDGLGNVYVTGRAPLGTFPGFQTATFVTDDASPLSTRGAYLAKLDTSTGLMQSMTVLDGQYSLELGGNSLVTAPDGTVWMAGTVASNISRSFPERNSLSDLPRGQEDDAFVAHFSSTGQLLYADAFGGVGDDLGTDLDVDASGNVVIVGRTASNDFPITQGALDTVRDGSTDAFVVKLTANGASLAYSTFLGGSGDEGSRPVAGEFEDDYVSVAVGQTGDVYVAGLTTSANFPTTSSAFRTMFAGVSDGFVVKINSAGTQIVFATYLGGVGEDYLTDVAVDSDGRAVVAGSSDSLDFPKVAPDLSVFSSGNGIIDQAVVSVLSPSGSVLDFSVAIGEDSKAYGVAITSSGDIVIVGETSTSVFDQFPIVEAIQPISSGGTSDAFVTQLRPSSGAVQFSTYFGGNGNNKAYTVAVDASDRIFVVLPGFSWLGAV